MWLIKVVLEFLIGGVESFAGVGDGEENNCETQNIFFILEKMN